MNIFLRGYPTHKIGNINGSYRYLTSSEITTALRPFYFLVHPDLFAQHPRAQHINDASLKSLNSHMDLLINDRRPKPVSLNFYIKSKRSEGNLQTLALQLNRNTAKATVHSILSAFDLPTKYIDTLPETKSQPDRVIRWSPSYYSATGQLDPQSELYTGKRKEKLYSWLIKNMGKAERRLTNSEPIRKDIIKLKSLIINNLDLCSLTWERGLGTTHLRGCMQGLVSLSNQHPEIRSVLQGRVIHFGNETGVSLKGYVVLSTSEVRHQWLQIIERVPEEDLKILRIPDMRKALSNSLKDIQVTQRKYQQFLMIGSYHQNLRRLVTSLGDYTGRLGFPKSWPTSLSHLQLVVESAAGPLMISPTGQILAPSSCPPWLLVNFITENMDEAHRRIIHFESIKEKEKRLYKQCKEELGLDFLEKDDSVLPEMMIECLERLLEASYRLSVLLSGARVWITHYYTVMLDGEICIPWNWDKEL